MDAIYMEAVQRMTGHGGWPLNVFLTPDRFPSMAAPTFRRTSAGGCRRGPRFCRRSPPLGAKPRGDPRGRGADPRATGRCRPALALRRAAGRRRPEGRTGRVERRLRRAQRRLWRERPSSRRHPSSSCCWRAAPKRTARMSASRRAQWPCRRSARWPRAGSTTRSAAAFTATPSIRPGRCPTSRRCSTTTRCSREPTCAAGACPAMSACWIPACERSIGCSRGWGPRWRLLRGTRRRLRRRRGPLLRVDGGGASTGARRGLGARDRLARRRRGGQLPDPHEPVGGLNVLTDREPPPGGTRPTHPRKSGSFERLREARAMRARPGLDDKRLTGWNALMIIALAEAAGELAAAPPAGLNPARPQQLLDAARDCADFILAELRDGQVRLLRSYNDGRAKLAGYLEDHAFLLEALIAVFEASCEERWLEHAVALADEMIARFADPDRGGFFSTASDGETVLVPPQGARGPADPLRIVQRGQRPIATGRADRRGALRAPRAVRACAAQRHRAPPPLLLRLRPPGPPPPSLPHAPDRLSAARAPSPPTCSRRAPVSDDRQVAVELPLRDLHAVVVPLLALDLDVAVERVLAERAQHEL